MEEEKRWKEKGGEREEANKMGGKIWKGGGEKMKGEKEEKGRRR